MNGLRWNSDMNQTSLLMVDRFSKEGVTYLG